MMVKFNDAYMYMIVPHVLWENPNGIFVTYIPITHPRGRVDDAVKTRA